MGFRIQPTYRNREVWKAVNVRAGLLTIFHGILVTIAGLILPKVELSTFLLILLLPLAAVIAYDTRFAYQLENHLSKGLRVLLLLQHVNTQPKKATKSDRLSAAAEKPAASWPKCWRRKI